MSTDPTEAGDTGKDPHGYMRLFLVHLPRAVLVIAIIIALIFK